MPTVFSWFWIQRLSDGKTSVFRWAREAAPPQAARRYAMGGPHESREVAAEALEKWKAHERVEELLADAMSF